ncbi:MAG: hypothetical protein RLZZ519_1210 [Bacteroidota bacterium]|jgi:hypothetical protein
MKTIHALVALAMLLSLYLTGCREMDEPLVPPPPRPPDYRDSVAGSYSCACFGEFFMMNEGWTYDTTYSALSVAVVDSTADQIVFSYPQYSEYAILSPNGEFTRTVYQYRSGFSGRFYAEDSLYISSGWSTNAASSQSDCYCKRQ